MLHKNDNTVEMANKRCLTGPAKHVLLFVE